MTAEEKINYLKKYGSEPISYSTLQEGLNDFHAENVGFMSYANYWGYNFVLGGPVCSEKYNLQFLTNAIQILQEPTFVQIGKKTAKVLHDAFGYKITQLGIETNISIQEYQLQNDPEKRNLRSFMRKGKEQSVVYELTQSELKERFGISPSDLDGLSKKWLSNKTSKEQLKFLVRNTVYEDEPFVRKFYSIGRNNKLMGFVFFNPLFNNDEVVGYCADIMRASDAASKGHVAYMILAALEKFKAEGKVILSLGLSPCANIRKSEFHHDVITFLLLKMFFNYGNRIYNFKGIYDNKKQYRGVEEEVFVAIKKVPIFKLIAINKYIGVI